MTNKPIKVHQSGVDLFVFKRGSVEQGFIEYMVWGSPTATELRPLTSDHYGSVTLQDQMLGNGWSMDVSGASWHCDADEVHYMVAVLTRLEQIASLGIEALMSTREEPTS